MNIHWVVVVFAAAAPVVVVGVVPFPIQNQIFDWDATITIPFWDDDHPFRVVVVVGMMVIITFLLVRNDLE